MPAITLDYGTGLNLAADRLVVLSMNVFNAPNNFRFLVSKEIASPARRNRNDKVCFLTWFIPIGLFEVTPSGSSIAQLYVKNIVFMFLDEKKAS